MLCNYFLFVFLINIISQYLVIKTLAERITDYSCCQTINLEQKCQKSLYLSFALYYCGMNGEDWLLTRPPCNNVNIYHGKIIPSKSTTNPPSSQPLSLSYEWDHPIVCTQSFPQLGGPLCLFTSASFALGRGISIITTPQIADEFLTLPAVVDAHLSSQFNSNTNATNGHREGAESRPWKSVAIRGRGMGVVATRPLTFGTLLTAYTPLLLVLHSAPQIINPPELEPFFRRAAAQLPVTSRDMLLSLARTSGLDEYMIHDIIQTNLFEFEIAGEQHMAVFPETARINHDCAPKYVWLKLNTQSIT